jgi:hypothetical protein
MEQIPKIVRERLQAAPTPVEHPDADVLTAFSENSLNEREREQVLLHLAACVDCREVAALAQPEPEPAYAAVAAVTAPARPAPTSAARWFRQPIFRWGALAACAVIVGAAVLLPYREARKKTLAPVAAEKISVTKELDEIITAEKKDELADLKQSARRDQNARSLQAANELAAKQQTRQELAKTQVAKNFPASPMISVPPGREAARSKLKILPGAAAGAMAATPPLEAHVVGGAVDKDARASAELGRADQSVTISAAAPSAAQSVDTVQIPSKASAPVPVPAQTAEVSAKSKSTGNALVSTDPNTLYHTAANVVASRWTLASDGSVLLRSLDAGKSWETVMVARNVIFRSVSAFGQQVWAGGKGGALFHSLDGGEHWLQVRPLVHGQLMTADVLRVEFTDAAHGNLTTTEGIWSTSDGGVTWQKQ